ncbi:M23 family metallopeptidase [Antribacter sp. KLBMP9083]|uniref:M23 family metallopeptidase n=1 Tax=Antribacter soli TaxID=2910976 RepID=A0AA41QHB4_9MICO|nr:M23 family metallopeptidase [Antribacter soli]MCF4123128.1 M23 family metallopeptidase [Antribacter soli]
MSAWHRPNSTAGKITSKFGPRPPIPNAPAASLNHLGVDLRAGTVGVDSDVYAAADGEVRRIFQTQLGAWVLEIDHGENTMTRYVHMQRAGIDPVVGEQVAGGQHIATASNSGAPTVHLHFEVLVDGRQVDPVPFLQDRGIDLTVITVSNGPSGPGTADIASLFGAPAPLTPEKDMTPQQDAALAEVFTNSKRLIQINEALVKYILDPAGRGHQADDRVLGSLQDRKFRNATVAKTLDQLDGQVLRDEITAGTARAVSETSAAFHQLVALTSGAEATDIDPAALADALVKALGPDLGRRVADEFATRLG